MAGRELDRYRAIDASARLKSLLSQLEAREREAGGVSGELGEAGSELEALRAEIGGLEGRKRSMMDDAARHEAEEREIKSRISEVVARYESASSDIMVSKRRIEALGGRIPGLLEEAGSLRGRGEGIASRIAGARSRAEEARGRLGALGDEAREIDGRRRAVLEAQSAAARRRSAVDGRIGALRARLGEAELARSKADGRREHAAGLARSNSARLESAEAGLAELEAAGARLDGLVSSAESAVSASRARTGRLQARRQKLLRDLEELGTIRERSSRAANQYESRIKTVKGFMHEDYTVARLMEDAGKLGILGLAYQMLEWDGADERAALAVSSDWLKAIVVQDFATLVSIAEAARERGLPKLRIIPLDAIPDLESRAPRMAGIVGPLASRIRCRPGHSALRAFLFGGVVLAEGREAARAASEAGYRAVTRDGECFEASGASAVIDISSKISRITRLISMSGDIDGLFRSISVMDGYVSRKKAALRRAEEAADAEAARLAGARGSLASAAENRDNLRTRLESASEMRVALVARIGRRREEESAARAESGEAASRAASLRAEIDEAGRDYAPGEQDRIAAELEEVIGAKAGADSRRAGASDELRDAEAELAAAEAESSRVASEASGLESEAESSRAEAAELESRVRELEAQVGPSKEELAGLRDREQRLFSSSGYSVEALRELDGRLGGLLSRERKLAGRAAALERRSDALKAEIAGMREKEAALKRAIGPYGYSDIPMYDVSGMMAGLSSELESLSSLNANAPARYAEVSAGYRSMSDRKNTLEGERNRIVGFIEGVEKDKKQTFLDAFDVVDREVRGIFSKMTGGEAWLEIEDEDDVFGSGLTYMIQFKGKKKRGSTSISGGEKTLAAIVFVLALQRLRPSPFYLFDEVDAHLDAPNAQRLADILEERSRESQFLMVSLKESVIQKARLVYGVFSKNNASHVVVYKDKRAAAEAGLQRPSAA